MAYGPHETDQQTLRAYELSAQADTRLEAGDLEQARSLMKEAARLDGTYSIRAALCGTPDPRRVRVQPTVRKLLAPFLLDAGFQCNPGNLANGDGIFERRRGTTTHSLMVGRDKFGGRLGMTVCRYTNPAAEVTYFDWRVANVRTGSLAYRTQRELEAVCTRWTELLKRWAFPWLETGANPEAASP